MLLVHGLGGSSINWTEVGPDLTSHGRVMAPDLPGFGRSPPAGRTADVNDQAELLAEFVQMHTDEPALVIGNSMGGLIAMLLAARHPHLVHRLVLVNPAAPSWRPSTINAGWALMMGIYLLPRVNKIAFNALQNRGDAARRTAESMDMIAASGDRVPEHVTRMHTEVALERENMPWTGAAFIQAYKSTVKCLVPPSRYDRIVHRIMAPTLLMHGTVDGIVPYSAAQRLAEQRRDWTFATLQDTGHVPQMEAAETLLKLVDEFMGDHEAV